MPQSCTPRNCPASPRWGRARVSGWAGPGERVSKPGRAGEPARGQGGRCRRLPGWSDGPSAAEQLPVQLAVVFHEAGLAEALGDPSAAFGRHAGCFLRVRQGLG